MSQQGSHERVRTAALLPPPRPNHRLRELRRNRGWSYADLGREAGGISRKTIREIEEGLTRNPRIGTMFPIAEALRTTVDDLESRRPKERAT